MFFTDADRRKLDAIVTMQELHNNRLERIMSKVDDLISAMNDETTAIAKRIDMLRGEIAASMTAGEIVKPETLTALAQLSDRLHQMGQDPTDPIPGAGGLPEAPPAPATPPAPAMPPATPPAGSTP